MGIGAAHAQSAAAVNKYLTQNPTATPNAGTSFSNVQNPTTATPYTYVVTVDYGPSASGTVSLSDTLPPGFVVTGCSAFLDATPMTVPGCPASGTIGASIGPFPTSTSTGHRVTIYITGSFTVGGQVTNSATATVPAGTASGAVTSFIDTLPPTFNLAVTKTADHITAAFGDTIVYTTTVTNTGTADLPMTNVVAVYDRLTNTSTGVEMDVTWGWLNCTSSPASPPSTCLSAPVPQASPPTTLLPGQSLDIFSSSATSTTGIGVDPSIAGGVLKAGASMTIQYYVTFETSDPCAPTPPSLKNRSYLGLGGSAGNFPDSNAADNAAEVSIPFTSLPVTCPPPPLKVTKTITSGPPSWGNWMVYEIDVTNISGVKVGLKYKDLVKGAPATTVFDADLSIGSMNCIGITCAHQYFTPQTWIGSAPKMLFQRQPSAGFLTMLPNASFKLIYKAKYDAVCAVNGDPVIIQNQFDTRGFISTTPAQNFHMLNTHNVKMPPLPVCSVKVSKNWKPVPVVDPTIPAQFGTVIGTYRVNWTNASSSFGLKLGAMWDVMHIDDMLYAMTPVTYSSPSCVSSAGSPVNNLVSATSANVSPTMPGQQWQGAQIIRIANKTFLPSESVTCEFTVTAQRPPASEVNCQAQGAPNLWNIALADLDPAYDPTSAPPWKSATVQKRLPLCRNVTITKIATPAKVIAGDPVNWTLIFQNNGPAPNQPISFSSQDIVPPAVLPISSGPLCGFGTGGTTCSASLSSGAINTTISNLPAGQQIGVIFTSTSPSQPYQFIPNTVTALETPGFYYHAPNPSATATLATGWPTVTKAFTPAKVFGPGQPVSLTFTVTNLSYKPGVAGMNFTDQLPTGMLPQPATLLGCGGSVQVNASGQVSLNNGVLPSGAVSCQFTVPVTYNRCGTFANTPANVVGVPVKIDTSGLSATLTVACLKAVTGNGIDSPSFRGHGCALYDSGDMKCWGTGPLGRTSLVATALPVTGNQPADQIDAGPWHVCITTKTGNAQCWGQNLGGQLGIGSTVAQQLPGALVKTNPSTTLANIVEVSAGGDTTCAIRALGSVRTVWCWGRMAPIPDGFAHQVPGITDARSVSVSSTHICVLRPAGKAMCWGQNTFAQLGTGSSSGPNMAPQVVAPSTLFIRAIKAGDGFTCILEGPSTVRAMCWGFNGAGTLANLLRTGSTATSVTVPTTVIGTPANLRELAVTDSASGGRHMCVTHGTLRQITCWGENGNAQIGVAIAPIRPPTTGPRSVATATTVTSGFDASNGKTCAITGTGTTAFNAKVECWGSRALGAQLGDGSTTPPTTPVPVTVVGVP
jgi:uncharacterized repeat protein (TIGR01451 family)